MVSFFKGLNWKGRIGLFVLLVCIAVNVKLYFLSGNSQSQKINLQNTEITSVESVESKQINPLPKNTSVSYNKKNELSLAEKKNISNEIRDILSNGNAKISVEGKEYYNTKGSLFGHDFKGTSQDFTYYYLNTIAREGLMITFSDNISFQRGDTNYGSYIYIQNPQSFLHVTPIKDASRIGWDTIVFGNDSDSYVFCVKDVNIKNVSRNFSKQIIYLGEETEKCYKVLLGKNPYICFMKGEKTLLARIYDNFEKDNKVLDAIYDVSRLIPKINSLKNENGKAYLY